ncbi:MAG: methyl-accepting chemotaxis protein [Pseudomonadota bacterium]
MNIGNWKIGTRLGAGLGVALLLMIGISAIGIANLAKLNAGTDDIATDKVPKVIQSYEAIGGVNDIARAMRNAMLSTDPATVAKELKRVDDRKGDIAAALGKLEKLIADDDDAKGKELLKAVTDARDKYLVVQTEFLKISAEDGKRDEAVAFLLSKVRKEQTAFMTALTDIVKYQTEAVGLANVQAQQAYHSARNMMMLMTAIATVLAAVVVFWVTRSITTPLNEAVDMAERVAKGDLTTEAHSTSLDETGKLLLALMNMTEALARTVGQVRSGTDTIATASNQIATGNLDLSSRTEQQASSLEETASSMEELTSTVTQNAENARQANHLVVAASEFAVKGGRVVGQVVSTMSSIKDSSSKIVDIIGVIDGIAFQTNILALNAAVEAARAGEQGRGFAVVAAEVRNLAQRSAGAAKEIKELIGRSVETVDAGSKLVDEAGITMDGIVKAVKQVADIMTEIAAASSEQSSGIAQVNQAIVQMDDVTQQNAALVEEAAAAAQSMRDQADLLAQAVGLFTLSERSQREAEARVRTQTTPRKTIGTDLASVARRAPTKPAPTRLTAPAAEEGS